MSWATSELGELATLLFFFLMAINLKLWFLSVLCCTGERCPHPTKVLQMGKIPRLLKKSYNFQFSMNINKQTKNKPSRW